MKECGCTVDEPRSPIRNIVKRYWLKADPFKKTRIVFFSFEPEGFFFDVEGDVETTNYLGPRFDI